MSHLSKTSEIHAVHKRREIDKKHWEKWSMNPQHIMSLKKDIVTGSEQLMLITCARINNANMALQALNPPSASSGDEEEDASSESGTSSSDDGFMLKFKESVIDAVTSIKNILERTTCTDKGSSCAYESAMKWIEVSKDSAQLEDLAKHALTLRRGAHYMSTLMSFEQARKDLNLTIQQAKRDCNSVEHSFKHNRS